MAYVNRKFTWDTNMLKRLYEKYVIGWLHRDQNWTEEEKRIMDHWFDDMNCSLETILEACGKTTGISNPNINYVNKVLESWAAEGMTESEFADYTAEHQLGYV